MLVCSIGRQEECSDDLPGEMLHLVARLSWAINCRLVLPLTDAGPSLTGPSSAGPSGQLVLPHIADAGPCSPVPQQGEPEQATQPAVEI